MFPVLDNFPHFCSTKVSRFVCFPTAKVRQSWQTTKRFNYFFQTFFELLRKSSDIQTIKAKT